MNEGVKMEDSGNQKFCLKWNNFQNNFMSQFEALKEDEDFVDVTLSCYGQSIKAHKVVLSACSPYLKNIFKGHPCKHPIVILDNLTFNNLEAVIQFVYTGQVYVDQTELSSFLKAAETLQIRGLCDGSENDGLAETNVSSIYKSDESIPLTKKRELDEENESKKLQMPTKRNVRKVSCGASREINECRDKEKDHLSNTENKSEVSHQSSSHNITYEGEQSFSGEEKNSTLSGDEEYGPGESKRPHWLDPRSCPLCNRVYSNLSNLRQHMKLIHNPTLVTCKICYRTFKTDLYLRRHLHSFHEINVSGNNYVSIESYKPVQNLTQGWTTTVKTEPDPFNEVFSNNEIYQVPQ